MKTNTQTKMRGGFTLVELLVVIAIIAALAGLATPVILKAQKAAAITETTNNARQVGTLLLLFDQDWGQFPSNITKAQVATATGVTMPAGSSSNAYLAQLVLGGYTESEEIFFAKGGAPGAIKGDGVANDAASALKGGECGFAYTMITGTNGEQGLSTSYSGNIPVLMAPMDQNGTTFDAGPYDSKAVYLRLDSSVQQKRIASDGLVNVAPSQSLFTPTDANTYWDGNTPSIKVPDPATAP